MTFLHRPPLLRLHVHGISDKWSYNTYRCMHAGAYSRTYTGKTLEAFLLTGLKGVSRCCTHTLRTCLRLKRMSRCCTHALRTYISLSKCLFVCVYMISTTVLQNEYLQKVKEKPMSQVCCMHVCNMELWSQPWGHSCACFMLKACWYVRMHAAMCVCKHVFTRACLFTRVCVLAFVYQSSQHTTRICMSYLTPASAF